MVRSVSVFLVLISTVLLCILFDEPCAAYVKATLVSTLVFFKEAIPGNLPRDASMKNYYSIKRDSLILCSSQSISKLNGAPTCKVFNSNR